MSLHLSHITKSFGPLRALDDVSFEVRPGEVHALLGENGAGKSTLMRIAAGLLRPDSGSVAGNAVGAPGAIGMVHQHFTSIAALSVGENIALSAGWSETGRRAERRAAGVIERIGLALDPAARAGTLSVPLRQRLELVKALAGNARYLLLDEPSAVLAPPEVREMLDEVRDFAARGGGVALITHKLDEVFAVADRVTVLRQGKVVHSGPLAGEDRASLAQAMIGANLPAEPPPQRAPGDTLIVATSLELRAATRMHRVAIEATDLAWRAGEIIGVAAVEGNGERQLLRAMAGLDEVVITSGTLKITAPVAFIPEDRTLEGLIPEFSLTENVALADNALGTWIDWRALDQRTAALMATHDVRATGPDVRAITLSGGNQQKLILARALDRRPGILVAEQPTRGLDIRATEAVHHRLRDAAAAGLLVVMYSTDLDEVLALADRIVVVANGRVRELPAGASRERVGLAMLDADSPS